jgi:hypothetical protein
MRVELSDPAEVPDLVAYLVDHSASVTSVRSGVIEVGFVGSWSTDTQIVETERRLRDWMALHPNVVVVLTE